MHFILARVLNDFLPPGKIVWPCDGRKDREEGIYESLLAGTRVDASTGNTLTVTFTGTGITWGGTF